MKGARQLRTKIGVIGCGMICDIYMKNWTTIYSDIIEVKAVADIFPEAAKKKAETYGTRAVTVEELLADPEIEIIANLTIPAAHTDVNRQCLEAGKSVYCEKPFAMSLEEGREILDLAKSRGLMACCAPDTFLGPGLQTCRSIIDSGEIGEIVGCTANLVSHGHETWHVNPAFLYKKGAGPMLDMGPYYVAAMVSLMGAVDKVNCFAGRAFDQRTITSKPHAGEVIDVEVFTNYMTSLRFKSGVAASFNMSYDIWWSKLPGIEIYGTKGTLVVPDPNMFSGPVKLIKGEDMLEVCAGLEGYHFIVKYFSPEMDEKLREVPLEFDLPDANMRGLGVVDMAKALRSGGSPRISADFVYHTLEVLLSFDKSAELETPLAMQSSCARPAPMSAGKERP